MVKKLAYAAAGAALFLAAASPAFAYGFGNRIYQTSNLDNHLVQIAKTGNDIDGWVKWGSSVSSGNASNLLGLENVVNTASLDCGCLFDGEEGSHLKIRQTSTLDNHLVQVAKTGNDIDGWVKGGSDVTSGDASNGMLLSNVVNTVGSFGL